MKKELLNHLDYIRKLNKKYSLSYKEFIEKYDACVERAKNRCDEGISETACTDFAMNRCETFLGTKENPIIK